MRMPQNYTTTNNSIHTEFHKINFELFNLCLDQEWATSGMRAKLGTGELLSGT